MRPKALAALSAIALALIMCMVQAVIIHNADATPGYPLPAGKGDISCITLERAGFMGASEDDRGNIWLVDAGGNPLCRSGWKPTLTYAPGIRQSLAIDEYYRESDAIRERLTLDNLLVLIRESGGFTYNPRYGATPHRGYAVSLQGRGRVLNAGDTTGDVLLAYLQENGEQMEDPAQYIGGWVDSGLLYLDVSIVLPDEMEARRTGWINDQTGIFNLGTNETIYLKGVDGNWLIDAGGDWLPGTTGAAGPSRAGQWIAPMTGMA